MKVKKVKGALFSSGTIFFLFFKWSSCKGFQAHNTQNDFPVLAFFIPGKKYGRRAASA